MIWGIFLPAALLSSAGWWLGFGSGAIGSLVIVGALVTARHLARRSAPPKLLASMSVWQIALVPVAGIVLGFGMGTLAFLVGNS